MEASTEKIIEAYIKIRDAKAEKEKQHQEELKTFEDQMQILEDELKKRCEEAGGNISTSVGYVKRRVSHNYWTSDWDSFYKMIKEHDAFHLLNQRISNKAMREFLEEHPDVVPPGLNSDSKYVVTVTRKS